MALRKLAVLIPLAVAGCQAAPPMAPVAAAPVSALCPPAGSVLRTSTGAQFTYLGNDPEDAEACLLVVGGQGRRRLIFGLMPEGDTTPRHRAGLRQMMPLAVGRAAEYQAMGGESTWRVSWRVVEERRIETPAGSFDTWVVERREHGIFNNISAVDHTMFLDRRTGALLRLETRPIRGVGTTPNWQAVSFTPRQS